MDCAICAVEEEEAEEELADEEAEFDKWWWEMFVEGKIKVEATSGFPFESALAPAKVSIVSEEYSAKILRGKGKKDQQVVVGWAEWGGISLEFVGIGAEGGRRNSA